MTFGPNQYVPVLKIKRGEKRALGSISFKLQKRITPLLEIVERKENQDSPVPLDKHLDKAFKGLAESVQLYSRCFLDAREIERDGPAAAAEVFRRAAAAGIVFTPVTGVTRTADVDAALDYSSNGVALRLTRKEFESGQLSNSIPRFLSMHRLTAEGIDLIIDLGPVDELVTDGVIGLTNAFLTEVPEHTRWRTFTISASAFPLNMGVVNRNSYELVERAEWLAWKHNLYDARKDTISRLPTFSDCAVQHPSGVEGFDFRFMQVSASVRYTLPEKWLLTKGVSTRITPATVQFPELATQLVYGQHTSLYQGSDHCGGCASIYESANGVTKGLGAPEAWRRLGTIHHITTVVQDLEALSWP